MIMRQHHSQFPGRGRSERNVVGTPMWPAYALRSIGLLLAVAAVLFLIGGLIQINPIWQWGPYHTYLSENGAQPDWYIGWLIGALRLMPNWELVIGGRTVIPEPFWGGIAFPTFVFGMLFAWPAVERRLTRDRARHDLLQRPRDRPTRTAIGAAFFSLGVLDLRRRCDRPRVLRAAHLLHRTDPLLEGGGVDPADRRVRARSQRSPGAAPKRGASAERDAGVDRRPRPERGTAAGPARAESCRRSRARPGGAFQPVRELENPVIAANHLDRDVGQGRP